MHDEKLAALRASEDAATSELAAAKAALENAEKNVWEAAGALQLANALSAPQLARNLESTQDSRWLLARSLSRAQAAHAEARTRREDFEITHKPVEL